jgi:oligoendopeptidase F
MRGTIIRETKFAEFEKQIHASAESGRLLTIDRLTELYRELLRQYFGPAVTLDDDLSLECLRIPHFYHAFYVYKYATGMLAAQGLADRVPSGGRDELGAYLQFLSGGCSKDPLDLLRDAGVDTEPPESIDAALSRFGELVEELDRLL